VAGPILGVSYEIGILDSEAHSSNREQEQTTVPGESSLSCPKWKSAKLWRDGLRRSMFEDEIQLWLCRNCGLRFSDPQNVQKVWSKSKRAERVERQSLKSGDDTVSTRQVCVTETKNLTAEQQTTEVLRRNEPSTAKGKIVEYEF
jgi:hypothetical protein